MTRHHDLDALRGTAMLLGIVLHAAMFLTPYSLWPVQDRWVATTAPGQNPYLHLVMTIHGFRMPVFFLISGFFTAMLWRSHGLGHLARHRLKRIGLPLLVCMVTIVPATNWLGGRSGSDPLYWLLSWLDGLAHLWFLWYLLLLAAALAVFVRLGGAFRSRLWWCLIPLTALPQLFMQEGGMGADGPGGRVLPPPELLGYYATFFFFGAFFFQRGFRVRRWWAASVPVALILLYPAALATLRPELVLGTKPAWALPLAVLLQISYSWLMCFGLMGLFRWIAGRERGWVRYLSDSSYWLYICHLPLVLLGQILLVDWPVSVHLKFMMLCGAVIAILLITYQFGVRHTPVGTALNGPRTRRARGTVAG